MLLLVVADWQYSSGAEGCYYSYLFYAEWLASLSLCFYILQKTCCLCTPLKWIQLLFHPFPAFWVFVYLFSLLGSFFMFLFLLFAGSEHCLQSVDLTITAIGTQRYSSMISSFVQYYATTISPYNSCHIWMFLLNRLIL